jgi:hypothetical protein
MVVIKQGGGLGVDSKHDIPAVATVTAVGTTKGLELLAVHGDAAMTACPTGYV